MIWNIIDRRERPYRWKCIDAIIEPTWADNSCQDSDQAERDEGEVIYEEHLSVSVADATAWASSKPHPVTLYLYDEGRATAITTLAVD